jgi:hypothetical protein
LKWSDYILKGTQPTRHRSEESDEEIHKPTGDDSEESFQSAEEYSEERAEESSKPTVGDSNESTAIPFLSSHEIAKQWFIAGTNRKETRRISNDIVAHTIYDILTERQFYFDTDRNDIDFKKRYELEVKNILKPKWHIYANFVDYVNLKMFECNCHIFPLCVHVTLQLYRTKVWDDVKHQLSKYSYISKWSILREENRDKMNVYNDYDMIEQQSMNPEVIFTMPINLENYHWIVVIRRWFQAKLFFFLVDSGVFSGKTIESSKTLKQIPRNILYFLMDTPLWPLGQKAYWIRLPNVLQLEDECATRMLLHSYIVAISPNPFESLLPLYDISSSVADTRSRRRTGNTRGPPLNVLCRKWVHSIITNETWMVAPWMIEVLIKQNSFDDFVSKHEDWIARFCFELECTLDRLIELANIIRIEEKIEPDEADQASNVNDEASSRVQEKRKQTDTAENAEEHVDCGATSDEADPASNVDDASNGCRKRENIQRQQNVKKIIRLIQGQLKSLLPVEQLQKIMVLRKATLKLRKTRKNMVI